MDELAPGLWHWTAFRDTIGRTVHSAYVEPARTAIDPMLPGEGLDRLAEHGPPERIVLVNRHHLRHSASYVERTRRRCTSPTRATAACSRSPTA